MNEFYVSFIESSKERAIEGMLTWNAQHDESGNFSKSERWNLPRLCGMPTPPYYWYSSVGLDSKTMSYLSSRNLAPAPSSPSFSMLTPEWRDFLQAVLVNELLVKRNKPQHALNNVTRPLRVIATCSQGEPPWGLSPESVQRAYNAALAIAPSGKLAANVAMVVRTTIDGLHIADRAPLARFCIADPGQEESAEKVAALKKGNNNYRKTEQIRTELSERKGSSKLPNEKAFWELVRIIFTERPRTFVDAIRFCQIKLAIATGFRVGENVLIPLNWKITKEYLTVDGKLAGSKGGISTSLGIRHFAEKQSADLSVDGVVLHESVQNVPLLFEELISEALSEAERLTFPLRERLRRQISTGKLFPELQGEDLVPVWEMYRRLTGSVWVASTPPPDKLISLYRENFDTRFLEEINEHQNSRIKYGVSPNCIKYFKKLHIAIRSQSGFEFTEKVDWGNAYVRLSEVEAYVRLNMVTKLPDTLPFLTSGGSHLDPSELLFLLPIRAIAEERNGGVLDVTNYFSIGRSSTQDIQIHLGYGEKNLFTRYGLTDEDRDLGLNTHSLRHLQNAELFRLGVADTIITKRFNRRSVSQSHVYDHRSLSEDLANIDLPQGAEEIGPKAQDTLRLIMAKKIKGPLVDEFLQIQALLGDQEAFRYLSAEADGLHATPYGFCMNNFTVDPCPKHLECFVGCLHLTRSENPHEQVRLEALKSRMIDVVNLIDSSPLEARGIGWQNQLKHAQVRLDGLNKILETAANEKPFPDGQDLYRSVNNKKGTSILDL